MVRTYASGSVLTLGSAWLAADASGSDPIGGLAVYGPMGIVAMLTILGCRWGIGQLTAAHMRELTSAHEERDRAIADRDALQTRLDEATRLIQEQVIPLSSRMAELTKIQLDQLGQAAHRG